MDQEHITIIPFYYVVDKKPESSILFLVQRYEITVIMVMAEGYAHDTIYSVNYLITLEISS